MEVRLMPVEQGDTVAVKYTGKLTSGEVFDSNEDGEPLSFTVGGGQVIEGFETAVVGLEEGETTTVEIPPEKAYGEKEDQLVREVDRESVSGDWEVKEGLQVQVRDSAGNVYPATITDVSNDTVTLDLNHPLAGQTLVFDIKVEGVQKTA